MKKTEYCPGCHSPMIEKPLFTSMYLECPRCDKPSAMVARDCAYDPSGGWDDLDETSYPAPCYQSLRKQDANKTIHRYETGARFCTCGGREVPLRKPTAPPESMWSVHDETVITLPPGFSLDVEKLKALADEWKKNFPAATHGRWSGKTPNVMTIPRSAEEQRKLGMSPALAAPYGTTSTKVRRFSDLAPSSGTELSMPQRHILPHDQGEQRVVARRGDIVEMNGVRFPVPSDGLYQFAYHETKITGEHERCLFWSRPGSSDVRDYGIVRVAR